jgi:hypothetical protein
MTQRVLCPIHGCASSTAYRARKCRCDVCREQERLRGAAYRAARPGQRAARYAAYRERRRELRANWTEEERERDRERSRRWSANNRERRRESNARYRAENLDRERARSRESWAKWNSQNPETRLESQKKWRAENPDKQLNHQKKWRDANPERMRAYNARRRARKRGAAGTHTADDIAAILRRQRGKCLNCRISLKRGFHVDHIMPLARGGSDNPSNIQLLCPSCNLSKHAKHPIEWAQENGRLL